MKYNDFAHTFPFCLNVYMVDKKKIVLQDKVISRRHHLLQQAMKFAFTKKYTYCEKVNS